MRVDDMSPTRQDRPGLDHLEVAELGQRLAADGVRPSHAAALFRWLQTGRPQRFEPPVQRWLATQGEVRTSIRQVAETPSADGETRKFGFELADGERVESVLMAFRGRFTACLSTQVGCAMGCVFCATGRMGFRRHLRAGEIVAQARELSAQLDRRGERLRNLVMMGMGEPLHNFDETLRALALLTDTRGLGIGPTRVTISTVGHVPGIRRLATRAEPYALAVSLHAATDAERDPLIPVNRRWPLAELMDACRGYIEQTGRRVWIAWTLIRDVNDRPEQAQRLVELLRGMAVHVNLIPLNPVEAYDGQWPRPERVVAFQRVLQDAGLPTTVRQRRGIDVAAGCGQLTVGRG